MFVLNFCFLSLCVGICIPPCDDSHALHQRLPTGCRFVVVPCVVGVGVHYGRLYQPFQTPFGNICNCGHMVSVVGPKKL